MGDAQNVGLLEGLEAAGVVAKRLAAALRITHQSFADEHQPPQKGRQERVTGELRQFGPGERVTPAHGRLQRPAHPRDLLPQFADSLQNGGHLFVFLDRWRNRFQWFAGADDGQLRLRTLIERQRDGDPVFPGRDAPFGQIADRARLLFPFQAQWVGKPRRRRQVFHADFDRAQGLGLGE